MRMDGLPNERIQTGEPIYAREPDFPQEKGL